METKIEYFDGRLSGCNFSPGYRITIESCNIYKRNIINFLSNNFCEGVVNENGSKHFNLMINSNLWHFFIKNKKYNDYKIILRYLDQVKDFCNYFDIDIDIDYQTLSNEHKLKKSLEKYIFEPNNQKNRNKIREEVRKILHVKPYDFELIVDEKGIQINMNEINILVNEDNF